MLIPELTELIQKYPAAELLRTLATVYESNLKDNFPSTGTRLKREVTIEGLRDLARHEQEWS